MKWKSKYFELPQEEILVKKDWW